MNEQIVKTALDIENEQHYSLDVRRKNKNGRDNTKQAEKPYFKCCPQEEQVIKTCRKEEGSCSYKDNDSSDKSKIVITIKIILVTIIRIAI